MPPKKREEKDFSSYKDLGTFNWKEATRDKGFSIGVMSVKPSSAMLSRNGLKIRKYNDDTETFFDIVYDREYCLDYFYRQLIVGLGFLVRGEFSEEAYEGFSKSLVDYSLSLKEKTRWEQIKKDAKENALKYPHLSEEQWIEILSKADQQSVEEAVETAAEIIKEDKASRKKKSAE